VDPSLEGAVAAYRGGYLPEERRELERALRSGELVGLAATNALELGIDVNGLDAVLLAGWPGTRASLWQQAGRAGRAGGESLAVLVAADDPLDTYLVHHPRAIFDAPVEAAVLDPENPHVLGLHLAAAAAELHVTEEDAALFGPTMVPLLDALVSKGVLRRRPRGWFWGRSDRASDHVSLRGSGETVRIVEQRTGRVLGTVDDARAHSAVHTGAVYLHQGETYVVMELDLADASALVVAGDPGWSTQARSVSAFDIVAVERAQDWGQLTCAFGPVKVHTQVTSFLRRLPTGEVLGEHPLDLPVRTLSTKAVWWTIPPEVLGSAGIAQPDIPGATHAAEHAAIGMLPLVATSDRWDIGGVSTALHPGTGLPTILIYDGHPGGAGFAERGFEAVRTWLRGTRDAIAACECLAGCPSCVQSPKCGNGNEPLDKAKAVRLLDLTLGAAGPGC
jgi:DEAD/DEAH box helicase domain-containing protein